nr:MAG TPA: hypothetical protein [Caudoviricetes sp.]
MSDTELLKSVKSFLRMQQQVTIFDDEINALILSAKESLRVAGVSDNVPLAYEYIRTYVRKRMLQDASDAFRKSESERERQLINQLTYGG